MIFLICFFIFFLFYFYIMKTEKLVQEFRQEIEKILMPSTVEHYMKYLCRSFSIFSYSLKDLKNETAVKQLYNRIFARDISNSTRRKYIIAIWKFGDFLLKNKYFQKNFPRKIMELPKTKKILPSALKRGDF